MKEKHFPSLDSLDLQLMGELESNVRQTYKDLATKLGISRPIVASRFQRLLNNNVIRPICWADPISLRYKLILYLAISTQPGCAGNVANMLATRAQILNIILCTGTFDIVAFAVFRDNKDLDDFLSNELKSINGIWHVDKLLILQEVKVSSRLLTDEKEPYYLDNPVKDLDELDLNLIRELQTNPRQRFAHIAQKFGLYENTVRRRIQKLVEAHVIRIRAYINPLTLGYEGSAIIGLKCSPDKITEIADAVASQKQVQYLSICAGGYDMLAYVVFRKLSDLRRFIAIELGSIPGLRETQTMINYKVVKILYQIPV